MFYVLVGGILCVSNHGGAKPAEVSSAPCVVTPAVPEESATHTTSNSPSQPFCQLFNGSTPNSPSSNPCPQSLTHLITSAVPEESPLFIPKTMLDN